MAFYKNTNTNETIDAVDFNDIVGNIIDELVNDEREFEKWVNKNISAYDILMAGARVCEMIEKKWREYVAEVVRDEIVSQYTKCEAI